MFADVLSDKAAKQEMAENEMARSLRRPFQHRMQDYETSTLPLASQTDNTREPSPTASARAVRAIHSFHDDSSEVLPAARPVRIRSVRFKDVEPSENEPRQLDGAGSGAEYNPFEESIDGPDRHPLSRRLSECFETLNGKLSITNGNDTVLHRKIAHRKPLVPHIDTTPINLTRSVSRTHSMGSSRINSGQFTNASPASTVSTAATSFGSSPRSVSSAKRHTADESLILQSKLSAHSDENVLPPIEEDIGRMLVIPQQESAIDQEPSIATVETVAAAKSYLELHFNNLLLEPASPRSLRRRRLEKDLSDLRVSHEDRTRARMAWMRSESDHLRQTRVLKATSLARHEVKGISIAGYDVVRVLGKGSFGIVRLVTDRSHARAAQRDSVPAGQLYGNDSTVEQNLPTGKPLSDVFAMKVIRKSEMLRSCQEGHLRAERDFLVSAEGSRWVVPLIASFQDNTNLYLVMEYMIGGDFLGLLLREDVLDEQVTL
jgi:protein-serine/threonine kinase